MSGNMTIQTGNTYSTTPTGQTGQTGGITPPPPQTGSGIGGFSSVVPNTTPELRSLPSMTVLTSFVQQNTGMSSNRLADSNPKLAAALEDLNKLIKLVKGSTDIAAILIELASMQRQAALDQRVASRELAKAQLLGQAAETRQAAAKELVAAIVQMVVSIVAASITFAGAAGGAKEIKKAGTDLTEVANLTKNMNKLIKNGVDEGSDFISKLGAKITDIGKSADLSLRKAENITMRFNAISQMVNALGEGIGGMLRASAKMDEAQGQELAAQSQDTQADGDVFKAFMESIDELIRTAIEFIKKMQDAEVELMATASRL